MHTRATARSESYGCNGSNLALRRQTAATALRRRLKLLTPQGHLSGKLSLRLSPEWHRYPQSWVSVHVGLDHPEVGKRHEAQERRRV